MIPIVERGEAALLQLLNAAPVGLMQTTLAGDIELVNSVSAKLLLPLAADARLDNLFRALDPVAPALRRLVEHFDAVQGPICEGLRIECRPEPPTRPETQVLALTLHKTGPNQLVAVLSDITQQVRREQELLQYQAWSSAALTGSGDHAVASIDASGRIVDWHSDAATGFEFRGEQLLGRPYSVFYPDGAITADRLIDRLHEADDNGWSLDEGWRVRGDACRFWGSTMIVPLRGRAAAVAADGHEGTSPTTPGAPAYTLLMRDTTDLREAFEQQRRAGVRDELTGLCNRRSFLDAAELELARWRRSPRPLSLVMFDADHFKSINDTHGHAAGDAVLRRLAELFARTFRQVDVSARIGGEEFAVLLPSTDIETAEAIANRLRVAVMDERLDIDGVAIGCTVSGGVATMNADIRSVADLLERADRALYAAKAAGRNRIECDQPGRSASA